MTGIGAHRQLSETDEGRGISLPGGARVTPVAMILAALFVVFGLGSVAAFLLTPHYHGTTYDRPYPPTPAFTLSRADGGRFNPEDFRGKLVVYYFGYTSCPDVCPATLYDMKQAFALLGPQAEEVQLAFVTIDPENDTAQKMREYVSYFHPSFIGLVGTPAEIKAVSDAFGVVVRRADAGETVRGYTLTHTTSLFVADRQGRLRLRLHHGSSPERLAQDLRLLLRQR